MSAIVCQKTNSAQIRKYSLVKTGIFGLGYQDTPLTSQDIAALLSNNRLYNVSPNCSVVLARLLTIPGVVGVTPKDRSFLLEITPTTSWDDVQFTTLNILRNWIFAGEEVKLIDELTDELVRQFQHAKLFGNGEVEATYFDPRDKQLYTTRQRPESLLGKLYGFPDEADSTTNSAMEKGIPYIETSKKDNWGCHERSYFEKVDNFLRRTGLTKLPDHVYVIHFSDGQPQRVFRAPKVWGVDADYLISLGFNPVNEQLWQYTGLYR